MIKADVNRGDFSWYMWAFRPGRGSPAFQTQSGYSFSLYFALPSLAVTCLHLFKKYSLNAYYVLVLKDNLFSPYKSL